MRSRLYYNKRYGNSNQSRMKNRCSRSSNFGRYFGLMMMTSWKIFRAVKVIVFLGFLCMIVFPASQRKEDWRNHDKSHKRLNLKYRKYYLLFYNQIEAKEMYFRKYMFLKQRRFSCDTFCITNSGIYLHYISLSY